MSGVIAEGHRQQKDQLHLIFTIHGGPVAHRLRNARHRKGGAGDHGRFTMGNGDALFKAGFRQLLPLPDRLQKRRFIADFAFVIQALAKLIQNGL